MCTCTEFIKNESFKLYKFSSVYIYIGIYNRYSYWAKVESNNIVIIIIIPFMGFNAVWYM